MPARASGDISAGQSRRGPFAGRSDGEALGVSRWVEVTQDMIDRFGDVTLDPDPMHIDPEFAGQGPFGATIAFGFLTISLLTHLYHDAVSRLADAQAADGYNLNYGFDRLRLITPVPVGSLVRGRFSLARRSVDAKGRVTLALDAAIEIQGRPRPALVARWITMWAPHTIERAV